MLLIMLVDSVLAGLIYTVSIVLLNSNADRLSAVEYLSAIVCLQGIYIVFMAGFRMYNSLWRYAQVDEFFVCMGVSLSAGLVYTLVNTLLMGNVPLLNNLSAIFAIAMAQVSYRYVYRRIRNYCKAVKATAPKQLLIVGAGAAAVALLNEIRRTPHNRYAPVCVVDDDPEKLGHLLNGVPIAGNTDAIPELCEKHSVDTIFVCIPSATSEQRRRILSLCSQTNASVRLLPDVYDAMTNPEKLQGKLRSLRIEDLLGRAEQHFDRSDIHRFVTDKVVLVTGGGGSIGSELCRQVAAFRPRQLILLDFNENNAYAVQQDLRSDYGEELNLVVEIASIREAEKIDALFAEYRPQVVFHAAAHKHVPLMEHNPEEALKNNVFGTLSVVNAAEAYGAEKFVLISSDKAVNPTNFMGASKRLAEMIVQSRKGVSATQFVAVRFGNVLGSSGSVVPLFQKQIERGGPVTITHPEITRFFMTIPEAVALVLQAAVMARDGEIFVLDMGEPVCILNLAENMIRLFGKRPYDDIEIVYTGLRPGEKLYEELLMNEEGLASTANSRIFIGHQPPVSVHEVEAVLAKLSAVMAQGDRMALMNAMQVAVPTYHPDFHSAQQDVNRCAADAGSDSSALADNESLITF